MSRDEGGIFDISKVILDSMFDFYGVFFDPFFSMLLDLVDFIISSLLLTCCFYIVYLSNSSKTSFICFATFTFLQMA